MQGADVDSVWTSYLLADETGNRMDAYRGYLEPVRENCTNLEVIESATVTKLLLDGNSTATGVQYKSEPSAEAQVLRHIVPNCTNSNCICAAYSTCFSLNNLHVF